MNFCLNKFVGSFYPLRLSYDQGHMEEQIMTLLGHARQQLGVGPGRLDDWRSDVIRNEVNWVTKYDS